MTEPLSLLGAALFVGFVAVMYLRQRLYKCPECLHRSDYDHIAEVNEEAPFCPYCGTKTEYIGRKWDAWTHRLGLPSEYTVITADDSDNS